MSRVRNSSVDQIFMVLRFLLSSHWQYNLSTILWRVASRRQRSSKLTKNSKVHSEIVQICFWVAHLVLGSPSKDGGVSRDLYRNWTCRLFCRDLGLILICLMYWACCKRNIYLYLFIRLIQLFKDLAFITHRPSLALESHRSKEHWDEQTYRICLLPRSIVPLLLFHCCFHMAHLNELRHSTRFLNQLPFQQNKLFL